MVPAPLPKLGPPLRRRLRSFLFGWPGRIFLSLFVLIAGAYPVENRRGAKALQRELGIMQEKGIAVDWHEMLRGPVPDAENFGATPVLKGLADDSPREPANDCAGEFTEWLYIHAPLTPGSEKEWESVREKLAKSSHFGPQVKETSNVRAVHLTLDRLEPVFAELARAALLPEAVFTPSPRDRLANADHKKLIWPNSSKPLLGLNNLLGVRAAASVELGKAEEAMRMMRILCRMNEAWQLFRPRPAIPPLRLVIEGLHRRLWNPSQVDQLVNLLSVKNPSGIAADWLHELLVKDYAFSFVSLPDEQIQFPSPAWWYLRAAPEGWSDQARATLLRVARERLIQPVREHGISTLANGNAGIRDEDRPGLANRLRNGWIFQFSAEIETDVIYGEMMRRLTILALAAERLRLDKGHLPEDITQILTALPPDQRQDLDGHPLRMKTNSVPDHIVFYSVGRNLQDDNALPPHDGVSSMFDPDYCLRLTLQ